MYFYLYPYNNTEKELLIKIKTILIRNSFCVDLKNQIDEIKQFSSHYKWGRVYLIESETGKTKIGHTYGKVSDRFNSIKTGCFEDLKIKYEAIVHAPHKIEKIIHNYLTYFNIKREWFDLSADLIAHETKVKDLLEWRTIEHGALCDLVTFYENKDFLGIKKHDNSCPQLYNKKKEKSA